MGRYSLYLPDEEQRSCCIFLLRYFSSYEKYLKVIFFQNAMLYRIETSISISVVVDLCDEKGSMKKLFENLESYADDFLVERDSFILIKVESKFDIL